MVLPKVAYGVERSVSIEKSLNSNANRKKRYMYSGAERCAFIKQRDSFGDRPHNVPRNQSTGL